MDNTMNKELFEQQLAQYEKVIEQCNELYQLCTSLCPILLTVYDAGLIDFCYRYKDKQTVFFDIGKLITVAENFYIACIVSDIEIPDCDQFADLLEQIIDEHNAEYFVSIIFDVDTDYIVNYYKETMNNEQ